jgi:putative transposase
MSRAAYAVWQAETVDGLTSLVGVVTACRLVGRSRATHHRRAHPAPPRLGPRRRAQHPAQLGPAERQQVLGLVTSRAYADLSVNQVWACEPDEGRYWCSARTMYRILTAADLSGERRRQGSHPSRTIPELMSTGPNEVWSWDITKLRGPTKGVWYHAYVVIDIFSRYVVGWRIESVEDGDLAADLVQDIVTEQGTPPGYWTVPGLVDTRTGCLILQERYDGFDT